MPDEPGNQTPNTPVVSETELRAKKMDDLRREAKDVGLHGVSSLRKEELVHAVAEAEQAQQRGKRPTSPAGGEARDDRAPNIPEVGETGLREKKVGELRQEAKDAGVQGTSSMRKEDLVRALVDVGESSDAGSTGPSAEQDGLGAGPDGGHLRTGAGTSKSLKYSQEITSTTEEPERQGRSLATTHHEVIKRWADERNATPATVPGTEHGDLLGVLRLDFGDDNDDLRHVTWEEWFHTFDERRLNFLYQEQRTDGHTSTFFRLESPQREDA